MTYPVSGTPYPSGSPVADPAYSGTFIPEIWSSKLIEKFYDATTVGAISNTNYEGEIKNQGDKVIIRTRPTINIMPYEADQELDYQRPSSETVELLIDKGYYWNLILDDVMDVQSDIDMMNIWSEDASEQMKISVDSEVLAYLPSETTPENSGDAAGRVSGNVDLGTAAAPLMLTRDSTSGTDILEMFTRAGQVLDEANIPQTGRWSVLPAWAVQLIKHSSLASASFSGDGTSILRNGQVGTIDRFTVYSSNLLPTVNDATAGDSHQMFFGTQHALTFASQITKVETLRAESTFGDIMRGLQVYGRKVIDPTAFVMVVAQKG